MTTTELNAPPIANSCVGIKKQRRGSGTPIRSCASAPMRSSAKGLGRTLLVDMATSLATELASGPKGRR